MPDPNRPIGVDYYVLDDAIFAGTESPRPPHTPLTIDWNAHADKGVRFAILKARHGTNSTDHEPWFQLNYPLVKNAGMLRAPYAWLVPCQVDVSGMGQLTSATWRNTPLAHGFDPLASALQQANDFCTQILADGWGEPGDLPPAVDIEPMPFATAIAVDSHGRTILEVPGPNADPTTRLGVIAGNNVLDAQGHVIGTVHTTNSVVDGISTAPGVVTPARMRRDPTDLWAVTAAQSINVIVIWLAQVRDTLSAARRSRSPVLPIIYSAGVWREVLNSPSNNHGQGWDVQHGGQRFHVDDFAAFPYWFAGYPTNPQGATQVAGFPTTWATVNRKFIWQYAADPDRSAVMRITAFTNGNDPSVKTCTVEEIDGQDQQSSDGLTYLEQLAAITRPTQPKALTRISPAPIDAAPARSFNLLLLGQGFAPDEWLPIAQGAFSDPNHQHSITDTAGFAALKASSRLAVYADDGTGVFLRMRQTPSNVAGLDDALAIPPDAATVLRDYLPLLKIVGDDKVETTADKVWLSGRRQSGPTGALIAIIRNGRLPTTTVQPATLPAQTAAELYQLNPSDGYPVPVVAVDVTWGDELWPQVIVRALAQQLAGLADELELPGAGYDHPPLERVHSFAPNVWYVDAATKTQLGAATIPPDLVKQAIRQFRLPANTKLDFFAQGATPGAIGGVHLVEGGDGYRNLVLRSDFDCLMRRLPVTTALAVTGATGKPVRADVPFCRVCREWLEAVVAGKQHFSVGGAITIGTQQLCYDRVSWNTREKPATNFNPRQAFHRVHTMTTVPSGEPQWSVTIDYDPAAHSVAQVLKLSAINLAQRPNDPYAAASNILSSITFSDLAVHYNHRAVPNGPLLDVKLSLDTVLNTALTNKLDPPQLELASDGGNNGAQQLGVRLRLAWPIVLDWTSGLVRDPHPPHRPLPTHPLMFTVEVVLGLVLGGEAQVEPAFPLRGCRIRPQLGFRVRRSAGLITTGRTTHGVAASVLSLTGSVKLDAVNAIASASGLDASLTSLASGQLGATLVSASNRAMGDSVMKPPANNILVPDSGRKLAAVHVDPSDKKGVMPLTLGSPDWSWRYDYVRSLIAHKTTIAGAYLDNEPKGDALVQRDGNYVWPAGSSFSFAVHKFPRQGDYDALFIQPVAASTPAPSLPVAGDLGLSLYVRQGISEGANAFGLPLLGWGPGNLDSGADTSVGSPLVPPNQHVDITVEKPAAGDVRVTYTTRAEEFRPDQWQVCFDHGLALGYRYDLSEPGAREWVRRTVALLGLPATTMQGLETALADTAHPEALDLQMRALWRTIHAQARLYDQQLDATNVQQAPESGDVSGAESK